MSRPTTVLPLALVLFVAIAAPASAQQPGGHPFDGEWTLTFDIATPPGGVAMTNAAGSDSPFHMVFHASKRSFQVKADGTFAWREVENGSVKFNGTLHYSGTHTKHWASYQPLLKAGGTATATPTPPGSPQPYDRTLEVNLDWSGGNGVYVVGQGGGAQIVDAAGEQFTVGATTLPVTYYQSKWSLKPARTVREEISLDEIRETTTYEGSRQAEIATLNNSGKYKVTERIEVKHVRNLGLVPRG